MYAMLMSLSNDWIKESRNAAKRRLERKVITLGMQKKTWTQQMEYKSEEIWEKCTSCSVATGDNKHAHRFKPDSEILDQTQTWYHIKKIKAMFEWSKFSLSED